MTTILLIRHGHTDLLGNTLAGRSPGVHLSEQGRVEAEDLARSIPAFGVDAIFSSPLERTRETARPIADALGMEVRIREGLNEIDYGDWTGMRFDSLTSDPTWIRYNRYRSGTRIPGGERFVDVQARVVKVMEELRAAHPEGTLAVVAHGDVIRVAIAHYMSIPVDFITRIAVHPGSVSTLRLTDFSPELLFSNHFPRFKAPIP